MKTKEDLFSSPEVARLAGAVLNTFIQRRDLYARQLDDGRYVCIQRQLTTNLVLAHLHGDLTLGTYILDSQSQARFVVFDADEESQFLALAAMCARLAAENIPSYLESSRRGGHLWLFFPHPIPGQTAREFASGLAAKFSLRKMEIFPKQAQLKDGPGSLIRLPFGIHRRTGQRYGFLTAEQKPLATSLAAQLRILSAPAAVPAAAIAAHRLTENNPTTLKPKPVLRPYEGDSIAARIKDSISVYDFINHFVPLTANGRGLCPFHEDRVNSFSVHPTQNYWNCFAGCGGGSIIDFWMKWRNCDYHTAVQELSKMLLEDQSMVSQG